MTQQKLANVEGLAHPELAAVDVIEESGGDMSRSEVILKGRSSPEPPTGR